MDARELYQAGRLQEAVTAMNAEVRQNPIDTARRGFLCELLCLAGNLERADTLLDALGEQDSQAALGVALWRHLIRAEQQRQQFFTDGRLPEFLDQPSPGLRLHLEASIALREGRRDEAAALLVRAEEQRPHVAGECDGRPFDDFRDLDDLTASFLEVLTSNGKYYWVPIERVELIEIHPPVRPRDLLWPRAHLIVRDGADGEVYLPSVYAGSQADPDERVRLGRATEWHGGGAEPVRGVGQRTYLVGDEARAILELRTISFAAPA